MRTDKLEALIRHLLGNSPRHRLHRTQLVKLVFLADYEQYQTFGETITDLTYYYEELGPFTWDIPDQAAEMPDVVVSEEPIAGFPGYKYQLAGSATQDAALDPRDRATADRVLRSWGRWSASRLVKHLHSDPFLKQFEGGHEINFSRLEDPLQDPEVQDAITADDDLYESMRRAEKQLCARGG